MASDTLFTTFSKNLTLYNPGYRNTFLCPLQVSAECKERDGVYSRQDINYLNGAHIWQQSLGGRLETLSCCKCNSFIGKELERHASNHAKFIELDKLPYRMTYEGIKGSEGGTLETNREDGTTEIAFEVNPKISNPATKTKVREFHDANGILPNFNVAISKRFEERRVSLSYLHFAYLYLFHEYGYEWFYSKLAHRIRHQLSHPEQRIFEVPWAVIYSDNFDTFNIGPDSAWHLFTTAPRSFKGFQIVSPQLRYQKGGRVAVFLFPLLPEIHDSGSSSVLGSEYVAKLNVSSLVPSHSVHNQLVNQRGLLSQALHKVFVQR